MDFEALAQELAPYSATWLVGSRAWGLEAENSDYDTLTIYYHPEDDRRVFRQYPDALTSPDNNKTLYSLRHFCRLAAKGNPNIAEIFGREPLESGEKSAFILWVLSQLAPYRYHKGFYAAALGMANSDVRRAGKLDDEAHKAKVLSQAMRSIVYAIRAYSGEEVTPEDVETMRAIKFGPTPLPVAQELIQERMAELEAIYTGELPSSAAMMEATNKEFTQEEQVNGTYSNQ